MGQLNHDPVRSTTFRLSRNVSAPPDPVAQVAQPAVSPTASRRARRNALALRMAGRTQVGNPQNGRLGSLRYRLVKCVFGLSCGPLLV